MSGTKQVSDFAGMLATRASAMAHQLLRGQRRQVLDVVTSSRRLFSMNHRAELAEDVAAIQAHANRLHVNADAAHVLLGKPAVGVNQRRHGQVGWETVRNVLEAVLACWDSRGVYDGASTERTVGFRLRGAEPLDETVATQKMAAGEKFGTVEMLKAHRAVHLTVVR